MIGHYKFFLLYHIIRGFVFEFCNGRGAQKLEGCAYQTVKKCDDMYHYFRHKYRHTERDKRVDGIPKMWRWFGLGYNEIPRQKATCLYRNKVVGPYTVHFDPKRQLRRRSHTEFTMSMNYTDQLWCRLRLSVLGQDRSETKRIGLGLARCGLGLGLAGLVWCCVVKHGHPHALVYIRLSWS